MNASKVLSLAIVGLISTQQVARAQVDRTLGIGDQQIQQAQSTVAHLRQNLIQLDQSLAEAEIQIKLHNHSGKVASGVAIAGAAVGLGMTAWSASAIASRNQLKLLLGAALGIAATGFSDVVGFISLGAQEPQQSQAIDAKLVQAQIEMQNSLAQTNDPQVISQIQKLSQIIASLRGAFANYQRRSDSLSHGRILSLIAQGAGVALAVYGIASGRQPLYGVAVFSAGNLGQIILGLTPSQEKMVLAEIAKTRAGLAASLAGLQ